MHDIAGLVALAVIGLWIAYLVPHRLRYRQQLLESRTEDRFSGALRVLVVTDPGRDARDGQARAECGPDSPKRSVLLSPARGVPLGGRPAVTEERGGVVERPYGTQDRMSADDARRVAQHRAKRAATLARRAAAAQRRALLTGVLGAASVLAWAVVGLTSVAITAAVVPTVLLVAVLALGRHAAVAARRADAAWERRHRELTDPATAARVKVTGRAHRPSDSHTEIIARVAAASPDAVAAAPDGVDAAETHPTPAVGTPVRNGESVDAPADQSAGSAAAESGDVVVTVTATGPATVEVSAPEGVEVSTETAPVATSDGATPAGAASDAWSPVPVPRPTYTTKAAAPRREPLPLVVDDAPRAAEAAEGAVPAVPAGATAVGADAPALDLDAILARRRAAGE